MNVVIKMITRHKQHLHSRNNSMWMPTNYLPLLFVFLNPNRMCLLIPPPMFRLNFRAAPSLKTSNLHCAKSYCYQNSADIASNGWDGVLPPLTSSIRIYSAQRTAKKQKRICNGSISFTSGISQRGTDYIKSTTARLSNDAHAELMSNITTIFSNVQRYLTF